MLTILKNTSKYNFARSPVMCEIETDNMFTSGNFGDKAKFVFYIKPSPVEGDQILIQSSLTSLNCKFTAGIYPTGLVIPLNPGGVTDYEYFTETVLDAFLSNVGITNYYTVTYIGSGGFSFEAVSPGPSYSDTGSGVVTGTGYNFINLLDGTDNYLTNVPRPNYKIQVDLIMETFFHSGEYETVISAIKEPVNNKISIDFSAACNAKLDYDFPTPNQSTTTWCRNVMKRFYVTIKEIYGTPPVEPDILVINPYLELQVDTNSTFVGLLLKAGLSPRWNKSLPNLQLENYVWNYPLYLTTKIYPIRVKRHQPEFLYFSLPDAVPTEDLQVKIITKYLDGTADATSYAYNYTGLCPKGAVLCFPLNNASGIFDTVLSTANTNVKKFIVSIVSASAPATDISPAVEYIPDFSPSRDEKVFLFTNSMGGVDTLRTFSNFEHEVEFEKEVSDRIYRTDDANHLGMYSQSQHEKTDILKVFSGWKTKDELDWMEDLFLAKYVVEVMDIVTFMPIIITSKRYRKHKTNENLVGVEIEYYRQLKSKVTDRLAAAI